MFYPLAALCSETAFLIINILTKRLRNLDVSTTSILTIYALTLPIWVLISVYLTLNGQSNFSLYYISLTLCWVALNIVNNYGFIKLSRYQSLSEASALRLSITTALALAVDTLFFNTHFSLLAIITITSILAGGFMHDMSRKNLLHPNLSINFYKKIVVIIMLCTTNVAMIALYKITIHMQQSIMFHIAFSHTILLSLFAMIGWKAFIKDNKNNHKVKAYIPAIMALVTLGIIAESYAIAGLSITLLVLFSLIKSIIFIAHDIITKELKLDINNILAAILILSGIVTLTVLETI